MAYAPVAETCEKCCAVIGPAVTDEPFPVKSFRDSDKRCVQRGEIVAMVEGRGEYRQLRRIAHRVGYKRRRSCVGRRIGMSRTIGNVAEQYPQHKMFPIVRDIPILLPTHENRNV